MPLGQRKPGRTALLRAEGPAVHIVFRDAAARLPSPHLSAPFISNKLKLFCLFETIL